MVRYLVEEYPEVHRTTIAAGYHLIARKNGKVVIRNFTFKPSTVIVFFKLWVIILILLRADEESISWGIRLLAVSAHDITQSLPSDLSDLSLGESIRSGIMREEVSVSFLKSLELDSKQTLECGPHHSTINRHFREASSEQVNLLR